MEIMSCDNCWWCKEGETDGERVHFCTKYDVKVSEDIANTQTDCDDFVLGVKAVEK